MLVEQGAYAILMNYMIADGEERRHGECNGCSWCCSYPPIFAPRHLGTLHFANSRCGAGDGAGGKGGVSFGSFWIYSGSACCGTFGAVCCRPRSMEAELWRHVRHVNKMYYQAERPGLEGG